MPSTVFTPETLKFLRGLARHNDRDWFEARREVYERAVRAPLLELIGELNHAIDAFAPGHVRPPAKTAMRIYRDTRFSPDKRPYKRHLGAWWAERDTERTTGAGFYFHLSATELLFAAGVYMPSAPQLLAVRRWLAENHEAYRGIERRILAARIKPPLLASAPEALKRVPRGFAADHPAADLLRATRWGVNLSLPAESALKTDFSQTMISWFRIASPLVLSLSAAIRPSKTRVTESVDPLFKQPSSSQQHKNTPKMESKGGTPAKYLG